jgi:hypothetical protein
MSIARLTLRDPSPPSSSGVCAGLRLRGRSEAIVSVIIIDILDFGRPF